MRLRAWLFAVAALLLGGCARPPPAANAFLALGDSYTVGQSVPASERWPVQLAALLRARGVDVADPQIIAQTGWTTDELSAAIDAADPHGPFRLVALLIGVNDQFRGGTADAYRPRFETLLRRAIGFAGGDGRRVIVLSIPDWGVMPFADGQDRAAIGRQIDAFNAVAAGVCRAQGVLFVDVTPASRAATTQLALIAPDGLHPSGPQYAEWARLADAALRASGR